MATGDEGLPLRRGFPFPGRPVARPDSRRPGNPLPAVPRVPVWPHGSPRSSQIRPPPRRRARLPAPPGRDGGEVACRGSSPASRGGTGQRPPPPGRERAGTGREAAGGTAGTGGALLGWPLFHRPLRFCRPLLCIGTLKPRVFLEEGERLERKGLTLQLFSHPPVLLCFSASDPKEFPFSRACKLNTLARLSLPFQDKSASSCDKSG